MTEFKYNKVDHLQTALTYGAVGGIASAAATFAALRAAPLLRLRLLTNIPQSKHAAFALGAGISGFAWQADNVSRRFEWELYRPGGSFEKQSNVGKPVDSGPSLMEWAQANAITVVLGSWGTALAGCGAWLWYQPMTPQQKFAQARMYSQILAVGLVVGAAFVASMPSTDKKDKHQALEEYEEQLFRSRRQAKQPSAH